MSAELAAVIIVGLFSLGGAAYAVIAGRSDVQDLRGIIEELRKDTTLRKQREKEFEARCLRYLNRIAYLMDGIRTLIIQIEGANLKPCWKPEEWGIELADDEADPYARKRGDE